MKWNNRFRAWIRWLFQCWKNWRTEKGRAALRQTGCWPPYFCAELPEKLVDQTLYLWGEEGEIWQAVMICPCGCGSKLHMSTLEDDWPYWKIEQHTDGTTTLSPSIWRQVGCRSHFFLRHGRIQWC